MVKDWRDDDDRHERPRRREAEVNEEYGTPVGSAGWPGRRSLTGGLSRMEAPAAMDAASRGAPTAIPFRPEMEAAFGEDFGGVRAFLGRSAPMAAMDANAAARGEDVAFGTDSPDRRLVAHELTHVVQTRRHGSAAVQASAAVSGPLDAAEQEADEVAPRAAMGERVTVTQSPSAAIHADRAPTAMAAAPAEGLARGRDATLQHFMAGNYELRNHRTGAWGGFDVNYDPQTGVMQVTTKIHFDFKAGSKEEPRPRGRGRQPKFDWTAREKAEWSAGVIDELQRTWSARHTFHCLRPGWHSVPSVAVHLRVEQAQDAATAHASVEVAKVPGQLDRDDAKHLFETGADGLATPDQETHDLVAERLQELNHPPGVDFLPGRFDLAPGDLEWLRQVASVLRRAGAGAHATVRGQSARLNPAEVNPEALAKMRTTTVIMALRAGGFSGPIQSSELVYEARSPTVIGAAVGAEGRPGRQVVANHEFGHILGLGDEYPEVNIPKGINRPEGAKTTHTDLAVSLGQRRVVAEYSEAIMSVGDLVEPHHYVTFLQALQKVTKVHEWGIGPGPDQPAVGPGDIPTGASPSRG